MHKNKDKHKSTPIKSVSELEITRIGLHGDGMALMGGRLPVSFPLTTVGDVIDAKVQSIHRHKTIVTDIKLCSTSKDRQDPPCPHHATLDKKGCGGCALQFLSPETYFEWKSNLAKECLIRGDVDIHGVDFKPLIQSQRNNRRRAVFSAFNQNNVVKIGFYERESNRVYDWDSCLVVCPELISIKKALPEILPLITKTQTKSRIHCTYIDKQIDIIFSIQHNIDNANIKQIQDWVKTHNIARASWKLLSDDDTTSPQTVFEDNQVTKKCGSLDVALPPASFLQPTKDGENALLYAVIDYISQITDIKRAMDLFCGIGTFTLPLYEKLPSLKSFQAIDINGESIKNLHQAAQDNSLDNLSVKAQDLFKSPVSANDLKRMDVVVIDPPRIGAKEQSIELSKSRVPHVIMVSCNPQTMARDAKILCDSGYILKSVTSVDQFLWSHHLETVSYFTRII